MSRRALLVSVEGIDASGKTTLVDELYKHYTNKGLSVVVFRFPDRSTPIGKVIDQALRKELNITNKTLQFLFCANRAELQPKITDAIQTCDLILFDRYLDSAVAYAEAQGISGEWVRNMDSHCIPPDVCLFLELDVAVATQRRKERCASDDIKKELYDKNDFQARVQKAYSTCYTLGPSWTTPSKYPHILIKRISAEEDKTKVFVTTVTCLDALSAKFTNTHKLNPTSPVFESDTSSGSATQ